MARPAWSAIGAPTSCPSAQAAYPERFASGGTPTPPGLPGPAWINKPNDLDQKDEQEKPTQN
ncbi:hypothetical protein GCM10018952_04660 [Streptosporangium vulgare]